MFPLTRSKSIIKSKFLARRQTFPVASTDPEMGVNFLHPPAFMTSTPVGYQRSPCLNSSSTVLLARVRKYSPSSIWVPSHSRTTRTGSEAGTPSLSLPRTKSSSKVPTTTPLRTFRQLSQIFSGLLPRDSCEEKFGLVAFYELQFQLLAKEGKVKAEMWEDGDVGCRVQGAGCRMGVTPVKRCARKTDKWVWQQARTVS